ncbi:hypothetical protein ACFQ0K_18110 [Nocardioides caeni]|uniref:Uncharacterized protein n=1 Tax=Nocardioides caeni TaxID=574700 RepID=A0A4S8NB45_9ACTN|nr:hypothetical protein [Nocardioides caeni]THV13325.1 hypothetical protein E9934_10175 [Nocardioides caeni]
MKVCLVWLGDPSAAQEVLGSPGPWREVREAGTGLLLVETDDTVSRVYHEVKWLLPDDCPLLVAPVERRPKARGVAAGTVTWLRRLALPDRD